MPKFWTGRPLLFPSHGLDVAEWRRGRSIRGCGCEPDFGLVAELAVTTWPRGGLLNSHFVSIADFGLVGALGENDKVSHML
jgi:hypothetical protein